MGPGVAHAGHPCFNAVVEMLPLLTNGIDLHKDECSIMLECTSLGMGPLCQLLNCSVAMTDHPA